jgi:hypothetical protein
MISIQTSIKYLEQLKIKKANTTVLLIKVFGRILRNTRISGDLKRKSVILKNITELTSLLEKEILVIQLPFALAKKIN